MTVSTTKIRSRARRRGGVALGGARAAGQPRTAHRRAHAVRRERSHVEASPLRIHASACGLGLDRWPQRADGSPVGRRRHQSDTSARAGVGRPAARGQIVVALTPCNSTIERMSPVGHGLPSRLRWEHDRCTPVSRRLAALQHISGSGISRHFTRRESNSPAPGSATLQACVRHITLVAPKIMVT